MLLLGSPTYQSREYLDKTDLQAKPILFGCLPLETAIAFAVFVQLVLFIWFFIRIVFNEATIGGWLFLTPPPRVPITWWLEFVVYCVSVLSAGSAAAAIMMHKFMCERQEDPLDVDESLVLKKRCNAGVLFHVVFSMLRYAAFCPITGMALVAKDICNFYMHGMFTIGVSRTSPVKAQLYCVSGDSRTIILLLLAMALDAYTIWGTYRLWLQYRAGYLLEGLLQGTKAKALYGSPYVEDNA